MTGTAYYLSHQKVNTQGWIDFFNLQMICRCFFRSNYFIPAMLSLVMAANSLPSNRAASVISSLEKSLKSGDTELTNDVQD